MHYMPIYVLPFVRINTIGLYNNNHNVGDDGDVI